MAVRYYFGLVDYTSGVIVFTLDWNETSPGIVPYIDLSGLPAGQGSIIIADPDTEGGAVGVATVTSTVDGTATDLPVTITISPSVLQG